MSEIKNSTTQSERTIHTPSSFARKNLNYVQELGRLKSLEAHSCIRENLDSFLFFICKEGKGQVKTGGKTYDVSAGDAVFLDCRKHYEHISSESDPWTICWVHFNGSQIMALFPLFNEGNHTSPVFKPEEAESYYKLLGYLEPLLNQNQIMAEIKASSIISELVYKCMDQVIEDNELHIDNKDGVLAEDDYASLRESVNEHFSEPGLDRVLAIQYGLEPEKLEEMFEKKYGIGLSEYVLNRKFNKAKELLRFTIKPVDEIVDESGIRDRGLFEKLFTDNENITPEEYRRKWAQWIKS